MVLLIRFAPGCASRSPRRVAWVEVPAWKFSPVSFVSAFSGRRRCSSSSAGLGPTYLARFGLGRLEGRAADGAAVLGSR
jgi:hypothetical protein